MQQQRSFDRKNYKARVLLPSWIIQLMCLLAGSILSMIVLAETRYAQQSAEPMFTFSAILLVLTFMATCIEIHLYRKSRLFPHRLALCETAKVLTLLLIIISEVVVIESRWNTSLAKDLLSASTRRPMPGEDKSDVAMYNFVVLTRRNFAIFVALSIWCSTMLVVYACILSRRERRTRLPTRKIQTIGVSEKGGPDLPAGPQMSPA